MGATQSKTEEMDSNSLIDGSSVLGVARSSKETGSKEVHRRGSVNCDFIDNKSISNGISGTQAMNKDGEECGCQDKAVVDNPLDEQENSLDDHSSSKTCLKLDQVDESLMRAMIVKLSTQQKTDTDNTLPAKSWFQNGDPESPLHLEEPSVEQEGTEPRPVQIWITEKSHPTLHLKNDAFLKMCAVEEINRSDLMEQHRAYLNIDGNIECFSKADTQKEGISDFVDHFQQTGNHLKNGETDAEVTGNEPGFDLVRGLSELSIEDSASNCHLEETPQDSSEPLPSMESMLRDSPFVRRLIDDLVKAAECQVLGVPDELEVSRREIRVCEESSDDRNDSESSNGSSDTSLSSKSSSGTVMEGDTNEKQSVSYNYIPPSERKQRMLRCKEESCLISLPDLKNYGLLDIGLQVFHPRESDVITKLSTYPDTFFQDKKKKVKPINVVMSNDEVASSLMKALETTSSKNKGANKGTESAQDTQAKPKGFKKGYMWTQNPSATSKSPTKNKGSGKGTPKKPKGPSKDAGSVQGTSKPNGPSKDPRSSQSSSSKSKSPTEEVNISSSSASSKSKGPKNGAESAVKRQLKKRSRGKQKTKGSTSDGSTESSSLPTEVVKTPSKSVAESGGELVQGKILDEEVVLNDEVQKCIPAFFGKPPSAKQGFARHSVANHSSQSDLISALKLQPVTRSASEQGLSDASAPGSNLLVGAGPSTSKTSAPLGAIPARSSVPLDARSPSTMQDARPTPIPQDVRCFPQEDRSSSFKSVLQYYSNRPDEFGRLVAKSMESMTIDQRTHAVNIIWDVSVEGNNKSLCQYTRLSGIRNGPGSGKEVFRMGPSHVSDSLQIGNNGVFTEQSSMSYGFPQTACPSNSSKEPSRGFGGATQTQSLPPQKQSCKNEALNQNGVPPVQKKPQSGQGGQKTSRKTKKAKKQQSVSPIEQVKSQQNKKLGTSPIQPSSEKVTRTMKFYPSTKSQKKSQQTPAGTKPKLAPKAGANVSEGSKLTQAQNQHGAQNVLSTTQHSAKNNQNPPTASQKSVHP